jgi:DNA-binding XRE family transcriptional regulator
MQYLDRFIAAVRTVRQEKRISQQALAGKLNMNKRTILDLENGKSCPRAETAFLIASELNISIDAILFAQNDGSDTVSPVVLEFFAGKTQEESNQYIALCRQAANLNK